MYICIVVNDSYLKRRKVYIIFIEAIVRGFTLLSFGRFLKGFVPKQSKNFKTHLSLLFCLIFNSPT